jgi:hypothetical protein
MELANNINWYRIAQNAIADDGRSPYRIYVNDNSRDRYVDGLGDRIIMAKSESQAIAIAISMLLKMFPWKRQEYIRLRANGSLFGKIDIQKKKDIEDQKQYKQEKFENRWDKKLEKQQDMFGQLGI